MKFNLLALYLRKLFFVTGILISFLTSNLSAWTVQVLNSQNESGHGIPSRDSFSTFADYISDTGANLALGGSLSSYNINDSNSVIVNLSNPYTTAEIEVLRQLLMSNTRVLIFGEHNGWNYSNGQIATLVGGQLINIDGPNNQAVNLNVTSPITDGVNNVIFGSPGKISPIGNNGLSLTNGDGITLWGANNNFLVFMDVDALSGNIASNDKLAHNIANWLAGSDIVIPEPSTYGLVAGSVLLGFAFIRRRR